MPDLTRKQQLLGQLEFGWDFLFWPRMEGLTDEEYLWEPVANCWSIRPDEDGLGQVDLEFPEPDPAPFTTIAWRMHHIAHFFTDRYGKHFGDGPVDEHEVPASLTAAEGLDVMRQAYERWRGTLRNLDDAEWDRPCGDAEPYYPDEPFAVLVLHLNRELHHHAAECCLLRDLYRYRDTLNPGA